MFPLRTSSDNKQYVYVKFHNMDVLSFAKIFCCMVGEFGEFVILFIVCQTTTTQLVLSNRTATNIRFIQMFVKILVCIWIAKISIQYSYDLCFINLVYLYLDFCRPTYISL